MKSKQSITLIIPSAGQSTRFNTKRPKWLLTMPNGDLMLQSCIYGLNLHNVEKIVITVVSKHLDNVNVSKIKSKIQETTGKETEFLILEDFTDSQPHTVYETIKKLNIKGSILIKDCDSIFDATPVVGDFVMVSNISSDTIAKNKSYITVNDIGNINEIAEKRRISDIFCVGGYSFRDAAYFVHAFEILSVIKKDLFVSDIVRRIMDSQCLKFKPIEVSNYIDLGTSEEFNKYKATFKTIFCDLDGVLCVNGGEYLFPNWGESKALSQNVKTINDLYESNRCHIIITTARKEEYIEETLAQLKRIGVKYHRLICGLFHSQRVLINDICSNADRNSAVSVNLDRDSDELSELLINY